MATRSVVNYDPNVTEADRNHEVYAFSIQIFISYKWLTVFTLGKINQAGSSHRWLMNDHIPTETLRNLEGPQHHDIGSDVLWVPSL